jgi:hypothetical protein
MGGGGVDAQPTRPMVMTAVASLSFTLVYLSGVKEIITTLMFGFTTILYFGTFHTSAKRQFVIVQGTMTAFFDWRQCKMNCFHNAVIVANDEFMVKKNPPNRRVYQN